MEKVQWCLERIRLIRGVGIVTNEKVQMLFEMGDLDEQEQQQVLAALQEEKITPIPEADVPKTEVPSAPAPRVLTPEEEAQQRLERFESAWTCYQEALIGQPELKQRHAAELKALVELLRADTEKSQRVDDIIIEALRILFLRKYTSQGYTAVCGTGTRRSIDVFVRWLSLITDDTELWDLIHTVKNEQELSEKQTKLLYLILYMAPHRKLIPRKRLKDFLDD